MGVFAMFRRKATKDGEDATVTDPAGRAAVTEEPDTAEAEAAAEAKAGAVEIPKQQSAEAAADDEAGEGART
ncbi:hypothetical protein [Streptomyces sp. NPDC048659]|uniref:hypothetical protein n=1 Tax=Streptomyces sp. NPDC048659 TaxID=3155489 RepID=UPI00342A979B